MYVCNMCTSVYGAFSSSRLPACRINITRTLVPANGYMFNIVQLHNPCLSPARDTIDQIQAISPFLFLVPLLVSFFPARRKHERAFPSSSAGHLLPTFHLCPIQLGLPPSRTMKRTRAKGKIRDGSNDGAP